MTILILIAAAAVVAVLEAVTLRRGLDGVEWDYSLSVISAEPGQEFDLILTFRNRTRLIVPYIRFQTELPDGLRSHAADRISGIAQRAEINGTVWLLPRQTLIRRVHVSAEKRGRYILGNLSVYGGDFLGLRETRRSEYRFREVVIYPERPPIASLENVYGSFLGDLSVSRFLYEDPVLTLGFREYSGREPMRSIAWNQSARMGQLMVKNYDHTVEPSLSVVVDIICEGAEQETLVERTLQLARAVCEGLEKKGAKYDFSINAILAGSMRTQGYFTEGLGDRHLRGVLECLGRATYRASISVTSLIDRRVRDSAARGILLITPKRTAASDAAVRLAERHGSKVLILSAKEAVEC